MRALVLGASWAAIASATGILAAEEPQGIVRLSLPPEEQEVRPVAVPSGPEDTVELDFPWPVEEWAGRGFTPDPEKYAGDFVIEASRSGGRVFVTPISAGAHRVLDVVVSLPDGRTRGIPIEFVPAPPGLAWRKVIFRDGSPQPGVTPSFSLRREPPKARFRDPSPDSLLGLATTLRLMLSTTEAGARAVAAANPALSFSELPGRPESFGDFTLTQRFAVRDSTTDSLGICASVANATARRLLFDPTGWVVRAGDRVYPVTTVDFPGELEPGSSAAAILVVGRAPDGLPTLLAPQNTFHLSARLIAAVNPRPVLRMGLPGLGPP